MRLAAGSDPLIWGQRRIASDEVHAIKGYAQLFSDQLDLRRRDALSQFTFAGVGRHASVRANRDPRIELSRPGACFAPFGSLREGRSQHALHAKTDDQRSSPFQEGPAGESRTSQRGERAGRQSGCALDFSCASHRIISLLARLIARSIRTLVKQRQRTPDIACWISCSLAFGFLSRKAFAVMMTPFRQKPHWAACSSMNAL